MRPWSDKSQLKNNQTQNNSISCSIYDDYLSARFFVSLQPNLIIKIKSLQIQTKNIFSSFSNFPYPFITHHNTKVQKPLKPKSTSQPHSSPFSSFHFSILKNQSKNFPNFFKTLTLWNSRVSHFPKITSSSPLQFHLLHYPTVFRRYSHSAPIAVAGGVYAPPRTLIL
jgi:hypothetical protein